MNFVTYCVEVQFMKRFTKDYEGFLNDSDILSDSASLHIDVGAPTEKKLWDKIAFLVLIHICFLFILALLLQ